MEQQVAYEIWRWEGTLGILSEEATLAAIAVLEEENVSMFLSSPKKKGVNLEIQMAAKARDNRNSIIQWGERLKGEGGEW
jgi:hypothetical protein